MAPPAAPPKPSNRSFGARMTAKAGPLPVWAWALLLLLAGYLVYRFSGSSSSSAAAAPASTSDGDTTPVGGDTSGSPPSGGGGNPADNINEQLLAGLGGLQGSVDDLAALLQSTPAFDPFGTGDAGSGAVPPITQTPPTPAPPSGHQTTKPPSGSPPPPPKPAPPAPHTVTYYTYAPGKAPKGHKADEAPAKGPAGTTLKFKKGKGYYYG